MKNDIRDFDEIKETAQKAYSEIGSINCPYFQENISFNSQGWEHFSFRNKNRPRPKNDQYMRYKLFHLVPYVLKQARLVQGILKTKKLERVRIHNRTDEIYKMVTYYEFIAVIGRDRIKVIVKQVENGEKFFWSIIPFWGMDENTRTRILHSGLPEDD